MNYDNNYLESPKQCQLAYPRLTPSTKNGYADITFDDGISRGKGIEAVQSTLDFFIKYADVHFRYKESVIGEHHCPTAKDKNMDASSPGKPFRVKIHKILFIM